MASTRNGQAITGVYRTSLGALRSQVDLQVARIWQSIDPLDIDATFIPALDLVEGIVTAAQTEAARMADVYMAAYMTAETGGLVSPVGIDPTRYAGVTRDGRPVRDVLALGGLSMKLATSQGYPSGNIVQSGLARVVRTARTETVSAARVAQSGITQDRDDVDGYHRVTSAEPCAACLSIAGVTFADDVIFPIHGACQCTAEPILTGTDQAYPPPTGDQLFADMDPAQQDALYGESRAGAIRDGDAPIGNLASYKEAHEWGPMLYEAPVATISG